MRPAYRSAGGLPFRPRRRIDFRGIDLGTQPVAADPYPELGPEIAARHLWLVESAVYFHGTDAAAISEAVCLPEWNVRRALASLRLGADPTPTSTKMRLAYGTRAKKAAEYLRRHGPSTAPEIARACGFNATSAVNLFKQHPEMFRHAGLRRTEPKGKAATVWAAKEAPDAPVA